MQREFRRRLMGFYDAEMVERIVRARDMQRCERDREPTNAAPQCQ
jgi:hypothetical protein